MFFEKRAANKSFKYGTVEPLKTNPLTSELSECPRATPIENVQQITS